MMLKSGNRPLTCVEIHKKLLPFIHNLKKYICDVWNLINLTKLAHHMQSLLFNSGLLCKQSWPNTMTYWKIVTLTRLSNPHVHRQYDCLFFVFQCIYTNLTKPLPVFSQHNCNVPTNKIGSSSPLHFINSTQRNYYVQIYWSQESNVPR